MVECRYALLTIAINGDIAPEKEQTLPRAGPTTRTTEYSASFLAVELRISPYLRAALKENKIKFSFQSLICSNGDSSSEQRS
jgi:hypothetical protein